MADETGPTQSAAFDQQSLRRRLILVLAGLITLAVVAVGFAAVAAFERAVAPELRNRAQLIGSGIRFEVQRVLELGIPLHSVGGLDSYLESTLADFEEIDLIELTASDGTLVAMAERSDRALRPAASAIAFISTGGETRTDLPILRGTQIVGNIALEISPIFVETRLRDVFLDLGVLVLIAVLIALELVLAVVIASVTKPLERVQYLLDEQRAGVFLHTIREEGLLGLRRTAARLNDHAVDLAARLQALPEAARGQIDARLASARPARLRFSDFNDIRLALFLFSAATEISVSFLPLYAGAASRPGWLSVDLAAALPIVSYLGAIAMMSPFGGRLVRQHGARRLFAVSVPGATLALLALGFSGSVIGITLWQGVMAVFYAVAVIAAQEYAIRAAGPRRSGAAVGAFVAVIFGGLFVGSVLGGLIANRFGYPAAFYVGAALAAVSLWIGLVSMTGRAGDRQTEEARTDTGAPVPRARFGLRYVVLLLGVAVPMNATMVIFIWYLTPLMLDDLGQSPADIVRVLVLYYFAILFVGPQVARMADGWPGPVPLIPVGCLVSALALLAPSMIGGYWAVVGAVAGVGIGEVLTRTPLYSQALRITGGPGPGMDTLRLVERLGAIAALLLSALLLESLGAVSTLRLLAGFALVGAACFGTVELLSRRNPTREE